MKAYIYKQTYGGAVLKNITVEEQMHGFVQICCPDCSGSGIYILPDDIGEPCVICKSSGRLWVAL